MSSEKSSGPVACVVEGATATSSPTERRRSNRKCVIGAVTCAVVVAMIVTGVLVAIKLFTDADLEKHRIRRKLRTGDTLIDEDLYQERDSDKWLLKYHVTEPDRQTWGLNEFDKGLQILKLQLPSGEFACFVIRQPVVNGTAVAAKIRSSAAGNTSISEVIKAANMTDMRYKIAILSGDVSAILGPSGQDFCTDLSVYAIYPDPAPQQADTSTENDGRQRRQASFWYWVCFMLFTNCRNITYDNGFTYFVCLPVCNRRFY